MTELYGFGFPFCRAEARSRSRDEQNPRIYRLTCMFITKQNVMRHYLHGVEFYLL